MGVKRWLVGLVAAGSMLGLAGVSVAPAVAGELAHERLAGPSGVETSLAVAKHTWGTDWKVVYVASNRNPVDALPAATIGDGPVVLTDGKGLNLGGVKPGKIMILGGIGAVPQVIEDQAKASGAEVVRLAGADRNATAVAIAKQWVKVNGTPKNVYVTKNVGSGSPDAVAASVLRDGPILTFTSDASAAALPGVVSELKAPKVTALGGGAVVSDSVLNTAAGGKATARLAGVNRYETAFTIAKYAKAQKSGSVVYLASGTALKDAMVAGAAKDGVILLSPANGEGVKAKADALGASKLMIIGGTGVMPDTTVQAATTGIIPKAKSAADMSIDEMRAQLKPLNLDDYKIIYTDSASGKQESSVMAFSPADTKGNRVRLVEMDEGPTFYPVLLRTLKATKEQANQILAKYPYHYDNPLVPREERALLHSVEEAEAKGLRFIGWVGTLEPLSDYPYSLVETFGFSYDDFYLCDRSDGQNVIDADSRQMHSDCSTIKTLPEGVIVEKHKDGQPNVVCGISGGAMKCFEEIFDFDENISKGYEESGVFYYDRETTASNILGLS